MKAEHGNTFVEFVFGKISYTCYVEIQFHRRLSVPNVKTGEASAGRVTQNTSQIVEGRQRSVSPSGPVVTLLSRVDTLCHRLTRPCDTLVVRSFRNSVEIRFSCVPPARIVACCYDNAVY